MTSEAILYIQVPFSVLNQPWTQRLQVNGWDSARDKRYAAAVVGELEANAEEFADVTITAVRIGGGRTSQIGGEAMWSIVRTLRERYTIAEGASVSMECALADISGASMPYFKRSGINRFDLEMLALASTAFPRVNKADNFSYYPVACNSFLHSETNDSLGLYLVAGFPKVKDIETHRTFLEARYYNNARVAIGLYEGPDRDDARTQAQVEDARAVLTAAGFTEYVPLRFAREGCEDPFFQKLHAGSDVIGVGLGAQTLFDGAISTSTDDLDVYLKHSRDFSKITVSAVPADGAMPLCL